MGFAFALVATIILIIFLSLVGGHEQPIDKSVIAYFVDWRALHPTATRAVIAFTQLGGGWFLLPLAAAAAVGLAWRRAFSRALFLTVTVAGGRAAIEGLKLLVDRPRPSLDLHPVEVFSQSFPSAHAGNSAITYVALALVLAPPNYRRQTVIAAGVLAFSIGITRPMLGVHWPSDIVAGWLFGLAWVSLTWRFWKRGRSEA